MGYEHGCCGYGRRYYSKAEVAEWLGQYEKELDLELKAVKERRAELTKASG